MRRLTYAGGGERLDKWLLRQLPGLPQSALYKYHRQNKIKVNGEKQPLGARLAAGDVVTLYLPEPPPPVVLYEDENLLAVYKPAGLASDGPGDCLLSRAAAWLASNEDSPRHDAPGGPPPGCAGLGPYTQGPFLCHRLDTGTSGVILLAKTPDMLEFVAGLLREHRLEKTYYGLCFGRLSPPEGFLRGYLVKNAGAATVRVTTRPEPGAKLAETAYTTLKTEGELALVELRPRTGRTHQLRAQLAAAGTPLLGDSKYGDNAANRRWRCRRQCLCAARVRFPAVSSGPFARYSGLVIECEKPWFYGELPK